jgi:hypothetical protein
MLYNVQFADEWKIFAQDWQSDMRFAGLTFRLKVRLCTRYSFVTRDWIW